MVTQLDKSDIPSKHEHLLTVIKGLVLVKMVRYSWWRWEDYREISGIESRDFFSLTGGALLCYFNTGLVVGFSSIPSRSSLIVWVEKNERGEICEEACEGDPDYYPINAEDDLYSNPQWKLILNQKLKTINILKRDPKNPKFIDLPNEVGLLVTMENGMKCVLSHGLHDDSDDFSVIFESQIKENIRPYLHVL